MARRRGGQRGNAGGEEVAVAVVEGDRDELLGGAGVQQVQGLGEPDQAVPGRGERAELLGQACRGHREVAQRPAYRGHGVVHERRHGLPRRRRRVGHRFQSSYEHAGYDHYRSVSRQASWFGESSSAGPARDWAAPA